MQQQETGNTLINLKGRDTLIRKLERYGITLKNEDEISSDELNSVIKEVDKLIEAKRKFEKVNSVNLGSIFLFEKLSTLVFIASATLASHIVRKGIGTLPVKNDKEIQALNLFSFELLLNILIKSKIVKRTCQSIVDIARTDESGKQFLTDLLETFTILLSITAASRNSSENMKHLINSFRTVLSNKLERLHGFIQKGINSEKIKGKIAEGVSLYLQQIYMALQKEDAETVLKAIGHLLKLVNLSEDVILQEFKRFEDLDELLVFTFGTGFSEMTKRETTIQQI